MVELNPQMREMLQNPELLRQLTSPEMVQVDCLSEFATTVMDCLNPYCTPRHKAFRVHVGCLSSFKALHKRLAKKCGHVHMAFH